MEGCVFRTTISLCQLILLLQLDVMQDHLHHEWQNAVDSQFNIFVHFYGTPPEDTWDKFDESCNIPTLIMHHVGAPKGSYASIIEVLRQCLVAHDAGECYDPSKEIHLKTVHLTATSSQTLRAE